MAQGSLGDITNRPGNLYQPSAEYFYREKGERPRPVSFMEDEGRPSHDVIRLRDKVIVLCIRDAFGALKETVPSEEIMKAFRPYFIHCGMAISINGTRRFGIKGKGLKEVAVPYYWCNTAFYDRNMSPMMVYEGGLVVEARDCLLKGVAPEFCLALSHQTTEGICRNLDPSYHYVFTHHMGFGDELCRYVVLPKGHEHRVDDLGRLIETLPPLDMTDEEVQSLRVELVGEILIIISKVLIDRFGVERALALVTPIAERTGSDLARELDEKLDRDLNAEERALEVLRMVRSSMEQEDTISLTKEGFFSGTTSSCPFKFGTTVVCRQYESLLRGVCRALDPELEFFCSERMTQGEPLCSWGTRRAGRDREWSFSIRRTGIAGAEGPVREGRDQGRRVPEDQEGPDRKMSVFLFYRCLMATGPSERSV